MKKEFQYISDFSYLFFFVMLVTFVLACASVIFVVADDKAIPFCIISWVICSVSAILYYCFQYLKATFQADDKECEFQFKKRKLHFRYEEIKKCELLNYPEHSRFGGIVGYKIHLHIIDKDKNEHTIRQHVSADYSFLDYPQGLPKEVTEAELTEIGNFIKSKLHPAEPQKKSIPETDTSVMYPNVADSPEMLEILNAVHSKKYIKKIEHEFTYDFTEEVYQQNLILTLTNDNTYYDNDDLKIRFENISDLESNLKGIMPPVFTILDHNSENYSPENRYELIENEWDILSFYFEKAEISS
ncbi:MAG: hypothetical protein IJJ69_08335 [Oscillospiraceae bacterium]|nr:hypothetical protein [Oscillospiraceae bacterium]